MVARRMVLGMVVLLAVGAFPARAQEVLPDGTLVCGTEGDGPRAQVRSKGNLRVGSFNILHAQNEEDASDVTRRLPQVLDRWPQPTPTCGASRR